MPITTTVLLLPQSEVSYSVARDGGSSHRVTTPLRPRDQTRVGYVCYKNQLRFHDSTLRAQVFGVSVTLYY